MTRVNDDAEALTLEVASAGSDAEELEELTRELRNELRELDVDNIGDVSEGAAPPGAKGLELLDVGKFLVEVAPSTAVMTGLFGVLRSWLSRQSGRTVKVSVAGDSIELTGLSSDDQHRLVEQWIDRHAQ